MNNDKNAITAVLLCVVLYLGYNSYISYKYPNLNNKSSEIVEDSLVDEGPGVVGSNARDVSSTVSSAPTSEGTYRPSQGDTIVELSREELTLRNPDIEVLLNQRGGGIDEIFVHGYKMSLKNPSDAREGVNILHHPIRFAAKPGVLSSSDWLQPAVYRVERHSDRSVTLVDRQGVWEQTQTYTIEEKGYGATLQVGYRNIGEKPMELSAAIGFLQRLDNLPTSRSGDSQATEYSSDYVSFQYSIAGTNERVKAKDICDEDLQPVMRRNEQLDYLAFDTHYFLTAFWPKQVGDFRLEKGPGSPCSGVMGLTHLQGMIQPDQLSSVVYQGFFGPKDLDVIETNRSSLKGSIDFGFLPFISYPLLRALKFFNDYVHNYGVAIIILTLILKILFYPLQKSSTKTMKKMQKLQPELKRIKEKFQDDPQRGTMESMKYLQKHKVQPAMGCLPILPQMPVFLAFYAILPNAIELRHAPFFGWINDLSSADPYFILPALFAVSMLVQQKLMPKTAMDPVQAKAMMVLPVVFAGVMYAAPAGMLLYMIASSITSIAQQQWLNRTIVV